MVFGELHLDSVMMKNEQNFLLSAYGHGARTVVVEYPKDKQPALDRYLHDPSYANMAAALFEMDPDLVGLDTKKRAQAEATLAILLEAADGSPREAQKAHHLTDAQLALLRAYLQQAHLWLFAYRNGFAVKAGDLSLTVGLDKQTGKLVTQHPNSLQIWAYRLNGRGMNDRDELISATAAPYAAHGRVLVFVGRDHSGFLPNEHLPEAAPDETYPGLNYLFETKYHLPSIALAQNQISPQGYLAQSAVPAL